MISDTTEAYPEILGMNCAHNVERTIALLTQRFPDETSTLHWASLQHDAREYVMSCATCQKIDTRHKAVRASRFVLSTLKPMCITMDTIGQLNIAKQFKYILVIIDTFTIRGAIPDNGCHS